MVCICSKKPKIIYFFLAQSLQLCSVNKVSLKVCIIMRARDVIILIHPIISLFDMKVYFIYFLNMYGCGVLL